MPRLDPRNHLYTVGNRQGSAASWGGFFGVGADVVTSNNTILTVRVGYDELPMPQEIDGRTKYSGALVRFGFNWKK